MSDCGDCSGGDGGGDTGYCDTADNTDTGCHDSSTHNEANSDHHSSSSHGHTQGHTEHTDSQFETLERLDLNTQRFINDFNVDGLETLHQPINTEHFGSVFHARPYDDNYRYYNSARYKPTRVVLSDHKTATSNRNDMQICVVLSIVALVIVLIGFGWYIKSR